MIGPDHDSVALVETVDADPVTPLEEVFAGKLRGLASFDFIGAAYLAYREVEHIRAPARYPIHLTHECEE